MSLFEIPLVMSLLGFGMGTMLTNVHMCGNMLTLIKSSFFLTREECCSRRTYVFDVSDLYFVSTL